ncbi:MAG: peptidylprolyl isomerase [Bacteroidales bacterium]|nr:peptidylprolyl isomerase [Bacteroidales bacterium]
MQKQVHKMFRMLLIASFFIPCAAGLRAQTPADPVVMVLGKDSVRLSEFKSNYLKNNSLSKATEQDLREYTDLFVNFRLKCAEARALGMDTLPELKRELRGYRTQAAAPYLTEKSVNEQLIDEAIEHLHWDIRASHIMRRLPLEPQPDDTLKAYKEMLAMRNRLLKGADFAETAYAESDDPSARPTVRNGKTVRSGNKGDLGYFTAFNMIYEFEKAAYNTPKGQISMPVRSPYGYHLIYVRDRRPAIARWTAVQILITYPENATAADSAATRAKAEEAWQAIQKSMPFEEAVATYCTDEGLRMTKGEMDPFGSGRFEGDFMAPLYDTPENGVTRPFETRFGWHIVKVLKKEPFTEKDGLRGEIRVKVSRDSRSNLGPEALAERLKKEYGFREAKPKSKKEEGPLEVFFRIDSTALFNGEWKKESITSDRLLFSFADRKVGQQDFAAYIEKNQFKGMREVSLKEVIHYAYALYVRKCILEYEDAHLESKYPEFAALMKEYEDGILLYALSERKVWDRSETDSAGLQQFYESVKDDYMYPVRADVIYYTMENAKAYKLFCKLMDKGADMETINRKFAKKGSIISARHQIYRQGEDKDFDQLCPWPILLQEGKLVINREEENRYITVQKLLPSPMPLNEVRGHVVTRYQNHLEDEWIAELRRNNDISIDYGSILKLIQ